MSYRGERTDLAEIVGRHDERQRAPIGQHGEGPRSFGPAAYLARGPACDPAETSATYAGVPTADPWFHIVSATAALEAGRRYLVVGLVVVSPHATAGLSVSYGVRVATDAVLGGTDVGDGVSAHTTFATWAEWFVNAGQVGRGLPARYYTPAEDETTTFSLIVQAGLEPTGSQPSTLDVLDVGRSTGPIPDDA